MRSPRRSAPPQLAAPEISGFLDLSRPTGLILNAVLHHVLDVEKPHDAVARYKELLAPGSYLLLTHFSNVSEQARPEWRPDEPVKYPWTSANCCTSADWPASLAPPPEAGGAR